LYREAADADTADEAGHFERINGAVQGTVDALQTLITDVNRLAAAGVAGELQTRAHAAQHRGEYRPDRPRSSFRPPGPSALWVGLQPDSGAAVIRTVAVGLKSDPEGAGTMMKAARPSRTPTTPSRHVR
jgi:hypothetical protein